VRGIIRRQVNNPRPAAIFRGRIPFADALALAKRGIRFDRHWRAGQSPKPLGHHPARARQRRPRLRKHFIPCAEREGGVAPQPLEQTRHVAGPERAHGGGLHLSLECLDHQLADMVDGVGMDREARGRADTRLIAVIPVRIRGNADFDSGAIQVFGREKRAILLDRRSDVGFDDPRQFRLKLRRRVATRGIVERRPRRRRGQQ
jgi:hypothetical protein